MTHQTLWYVKDISLQILYTFVLCKEIVWIPRKNILETPPVVYDNWQLSN